jgi:predicted DNA-binding transcriptional regulator AlpA
MKDYEFLGWLYDRLAIKHGEDRKLGHMQRLQEIIAKSQTTLHPLVTPEEVMERYGIKATTLRHWRENRSGGPSFLKLGQGLVRYRQEDLATWELTRLRRQAEKADDDGTD